MTSRNLAKYTFTEQGEEVEDLKLEDGTTKIFLNMSSRNGSQELVSLLQYMKETKEAVFCRTLAASFLLLYFIQI